MPPKRRPEKAEQANSVPKIKQAQQPGKQRRTTSPKRVKKRKRAARSRTMTSMLTSIYHNEPEQDSDLPKQKSVLSRPTAKARHFKAMLSAAGRSQEVCTVSNGQAIDERLPLEILTEICSMVVVEAASFIYPASVTGKEQPDLAMTCNAIRAIVLPIYYGKNIFAVELTMFPHVSDDGRSTQDACTTEDWLSAIKTWSHHIRRWAFTNDDAAGGWCHLQPASHIMMLSITLPGQRAFTQQDSDRAKAATHELPTTASPMVEIHRDAHCLLQHRAHSSSRCELQQNPAWLNSIVINTVVNGVDYNGVMTGPMLRELLRALAGKDLALSALCCSGLASAHVDNQGQHPAW